VNPLKKSLRCQNLPSRAKACLNVDSVSTCQSLNTKWPSKNKLSWVMIDSSSDDSVSNDSSAELSLLLTMVDGTKLC